MREDILRSLLAKSEFAPMQAETLSKVLSEMVTREYLDTQLALLRSELSARLDSVEQRMETKLAHEMAKLTRLILIAMGLFATLVGVLSRIG